MSTGHVQLNVWNVLQCKRFHDLIMIFLANGSIITLPFCANARRFSMAAYSSEIAFHSVGFVNDVNVNSMQMLAGAAQQLWVAM